MRNATYLQTTVEVSLEFCAIVREKEAGRSGQERAEGLESVDGLVARRGRGGEGEAGEPSLPTLECPSAHL